MHEAPTLSAFRIQNGVRQSFGWSEADDADSAIRLQQHLKEHSHWAPPNREKTFDEVKKQLLNAERVIVIGAAVEDDEIKIFNQPGDVFIAADGAVGAVENYAQLACVVSDLDGGTYLDIAASKGQTIVVHAHGDNLLQWQQTLALWEQYPSVPSLILSHQITTSVPGMHNFGGFTDGDRALCLALSLGVVPEKIQLIGFSINRIGQWSGITDAGKKFKKLRWMERIVSELNFGHFIKK